MNRAIVTATIILAAATNAAAADLFVLTQGTQHERGDFGARRPFKTDSSVGVLAEAEVNARGNGLWFATGNAIRALGTTSGAVEDVLTHRGQVRDFVVTIEGPTYFALTDEGVVDAIDTILIPMAALPTGASALAAFMDGGSQVIVVGGGNLIKSYRLSSGSYTTLHQAASAAPVKDMALREYQGYPLLIVAAEDLRRFDARMLEPMGVMGRPYPIVAKWPCQNRTDALVCEVVVEDSTGAVVVFQDPFEPGVVVDHVPAGSRIGATRGMSAEPYLVAGNDDHTRTEPPEVYVMEPVTYSFEVGGTAGIGTRVDTGELNEGETTIVTARYSATGYNSDPEVVALWKYDNVNNRWAKTAGIQPYGPIEYGAVVSASNIKAELPTEPALDEIVTGPGPGPVFGPQVRAFNPDTTPIAKINFFAYGTLKYGVNVSGSQTVDDFRVVTGPGPGTVFGPHVRAWDVSVSPTAPVSKINFFAYSTLKYGVEVGYEDVDQDGFNEMFTGPGPSQAFSAQLRGWNFDDQSVRPMPALNMIFEGVDNTTGQTRAGRGGLRVAGTSREIGNTAYQLAVTMPDPAIDVRAATMVSLSDGVTRVEYANAICWECDLFIGGN